MFTKYLAVFCLYSQILSAITLQYNSTIDSDFDSVINCTFEIFERTMFWRPTLVMTEGRHQTANKTEFNNRMIENIIEKQQPFIIINSEGSYTMETQRAAYLLVEYVDDCETLYRYNLDNIQTNVKYIFIIGYYSPMCQSISSEVGIKVGKYDVSFFVRLGVTNQTLPLITFVPYLEARSCAVAVGRAQRINVCHEGHLQYTSVFPIKTPTNMNRCPLKVGMSSLYPLTIIPNKKSLQNYDRLYNATGADVEIMKIVTRYFNATMNMYYVYKVEESPYVESKFLTFLLNGSLDILAGGMYRIYGDIVDYSGVYADQYIFWVYTAERPEKSWNNLILKLEWLYLFMILYFVYSVTWFFISKYDNHGVRIPDTLLYGWGALTGTTSLGEAKSMKQKILNISYLIMCLHLSVFISIVLYSFLTIVGPPQLFKTNQEITTSGRVPYLEPRAKYFIADEKYVQFANTSKDCSSFTDCIKQSLQNKGITIVIPGYFFGYQAATAVNDEAKLLKVSDPILHVYYEMIINRNSPLVAKFQMVVGRLFEAGITGRLFEEAIGINVIEKATITASNMMSNSYNCESGCAITMEQFNGAFYFWMFGCFSSICVFVVEILTNRKMSVKID